VAATADFASIAARAQGTGIVYFGDNHTTNTSYGQQLIMMHEALHIHFKAGHNELVKKLGITTQNLGEDEARALLDTWLQRGCRA
jgi:hypothetical protein